MPYKAHIKKPTYTYLPGMVIGAEEIPLGAGGALATAGVTETEKHTGILSIVKTATKVGRYTITFAKPYRRLLFLHVTVVGAADVAYTATAGHQAILRNDAVATTGTIDVQLVRTDTAADAEAINSATLKLFYAVKDSSVGE